MPARRRAAKKKAKGTARKTAKPASKPKQGARNRPASAKKGAAKKATAKARARAAPVAGSLDLVTVHVNDLAEAVDFYNGKLGFPVVMRDDGLMWAMVQAGKVQIGIHADPGNVEGGRQPPAATGFMFGVKDVDQVVDKLRGAGVKIVHGPTDAPWGRHAEIEDPSGNSMFVVRF